MAATLVSQQQAMTITHTAGSVVTIVIAQLQAATHLPMAQATQRHRCGANVHTSLWRQGRSYGVRCASHTWAIGLFTNSAFIVSTGSTLLAARYATATL
ncbi:MAG: hypothetical protein HXY24_07400 [Rubrivivax sp.]|nr:hypothetical protein [Rubrivivax sp.]